MVWIERGACRVEKTDTIMFFPTRGESCKDAIEVCERCDVTSECLNYALRNNIIYGVWGGVSERKRRNMRAQLRRAGQLSTPG